MTVFKKAKTTPEPENLKPPEQFGKEAKWAAKPVARAREAVARELSCVESMQANAGTDPHYTKAHKMLVKALEALG